MGRCPLSRSFSLFSLLSLFLFSLSLSLYLFLISPSTSAPCIFVQTKDKEVWNHLKSVNWKLAESLSTRASPSGRPGLVLPGLDLRRVRVHRARHVCLGNGRTWHDAAAVDDAAASWRLRFQGEPPSDPARSPALLCSCASSMLQACFKPIASQLCKTSIAPSSVENQEALPHSDMVLRAVLGFSVGQKATKHV